MRRCSTCPQQASTALNPSHGRAALTVHRRCSRRLQVSAKQDTTEKGSKTEPDAEESLAVLEDMVRGGSSAKEARAERKRKRKAQQGASLAPFAEEPQQQQQSMPTEAQVFEGRIVTILALLFVLCLAEGLAVAGSGFLSESGDAFVQDVVYKAFTPTIGLFLAVSTAYGLWKQRQEQGQS